jgi:hypothetical protein
MLGAIVDVTDSPDGMVQGLFDNVRCKALLMQNR